MPWFRCSCGTSCWGFLPNHINERTSLSRELLGGVRGALMGDKFMESPHDSDTVHWDHEPVRTIPCCICNMELSGHFPWFMEASTSLMPCIATMNPLPGGELRGRGRTPAPFLGGVRGRTPASLPGGVGGGSEHGRHIFRLRNGAVRCHSSRCLHTTRKPGRWNDLSAIMEIRPAWP